MQNLAIARSGSLARGRELPSLCVHRSPILVERVGHDGHCARCLVCGTVGPARNSPEEARDALQAASQQQGKVGAEGAGLSLSGNYGSCAS
jgi:hypothetical protein